LAAAKAVAKAVGVGFQRGDLDPALIHDFYVPCDIEDRRLQSMRLAAVE